MAHLLGQDVEEIEQVCIWSGEGEDVGNMKEYDGALTERALKMRLKKECCGGDRWAYAQISTLDAIYRYDLDGTIEQIN